MMSKGSKASAEKIDMARSLKYISAPWKNKASKYEEHRPVACPEVILCVEIYEKRYGFVKNQEFLVLGSQLLTDLKDNIYCLTDKLMEVARQHDHSGYFLIEDTFYNDTRHYSAVDYSKPILDWFKNSSNEVVEKWDSITSGVLKKRQKELLHGLSISNVPEFKSAKMQKTRFSDLHFRLGAGYLYCHQCIKDLLLDEISALLKRNGSKISSFNLPARSSCASHYHTNTMISDELSYDITELANESTRLCSMLNPDQKNAFECVVSRIAHNQTGFFFVSRHGGTAKTFLWNAIITYLRSTTMLTYRLQVPLKNMLLIPLLMTKPIPLKDKNAVPIIVFYRTGLWFILYMQAVMKAVLK